MPGYNELVMEIHNNSEKPFSEAAGRLDAYIRMITRVELSEILLDIGAIPQSIKPSSSEEKLYSKATDIVLARCFAEIGLDATVFETRGNSADVEATSRFHGYSLVADSKSMRLSRTAKNQKDFKIGALGDNWIGTNSTYAVLCCPLYQYPVSKSQIYEQALNNKKVVAVGEIGLDYYWNDPEPELQKKWFIRQLDLAKEINKPVIIHSREAAKDTEDILSSAEYRDIPGVMHCYSYSPEMAKKYLDRGFYLGVGGVVTYKNARKLVDTVEMMPLSQLLLETDSPYLTPVPHRGKRNSSLNLKYIVEKIAEIKNMSEDEIIEITNENARRLFRI